MWLKIFGKNFKEPWHFGLSHWRSFAPLTVAYIGALSISHLLGDYLLDGLGMFGIGLRLIILVTPVIPIVLAGFALIQYTIEVAERGRTPGLVECLKKGYRYLWSLIPLFFVSIAVLIAVLFSMPLAVAVFYTLLYHQSPLLPGAVLLYIGLLLLYFGGVPYFGVRLFYWQIIIVEEGCGVIQSFLQSWKRTRGYFWQTAVTAFFVLLLEFVGFLLLIVGVFIFFPMAGRLLLFGYRAIQPGGTSATNTVE